MCDRDKSAKAVDCEPRIGPWISLAEPNSDPGPRLQFTTSVLGGESSQRDAFVECAMPLLEAALGGQHSCLFAYGETGSGKTFSMLGAEGGRCPSKLDGIVPQLCAELFRRFASQTRQGEREYQIHATYVEIFAHRIYDLLAADVKVLSLALSPKPQAPSPKPQALRLALTLSLTLTLTLKGRACGRPCVARAIAARVERR